MQNNSNSIEEVPMLIKIDSPQDNTLRGNVAIKPSETEKL